MQPNRQNGAAYIGPNILVCGGAFLSDHLRLQAEVEVWQGRMGKFLILDQFSWNLAKLVLNWK